MSLIVMAKRALIAAAVAVCTHLVIAQSIDLDKPLIIAKQGSFLQAVGISSRIRYRPYRRPSLRER